MDETGVRRVPLRARTRGARIISVNSGSKAAATVILGGTMALQEDWYPLFLIFFRDANAQSSF